MRISTYNQFQQSAEMITNQFETMDRLRQQAESGHKLLSASDNPVLANQIQSTQDYINLMQSFQSNGTLAQTRYKLYETSMQSANTTMNDVQTVLVNAQNGTLTDKDRAALAQQLQGDLTSLMNAANTKDATGQYLYSGANSNTPPYLQTSSGFQYQGSMNAMSIDIGVGASVVYNDSGFEVFGNNATGNGTFSVSATATNQGSAYTTVGSASSGYVADTYTISFVTNSAGELAYQVVGASAGQVVPAPPATTPDNAPAYTPGTNGQNITFNGVNLNINGQAVAGDSFTVQPSTNEDVFTGLQNAINLLKSPIQNQGLFNQAITQASALLSQASNNLATYQSTIGTRSAFVDNQVLLNNNQITQQTVLVSNLGDADLTQVFSAISQQSLQLQATQESFLKIQEILTQFLKM